jgi:hypothetical protein
VSGDACSASQTNAKRDSQPGNGASVEVQPMFVVASVPCVCVLESRLGSALSLVSIQRPTQQAWRELMCRAAAFRETKCHKYPLVCLSHSS